MKTTIHTYNFDISKTAEKAAYIELKETLKAQGLTCFDAIGNYYTPFAQFNGQTVELETKHLFNNQWNTAPGTFGSEKGWRIFDWAEDAIWINGRKNNHTKRGHYLEQTAEIKEIRRNTHDCGYCGKQEPAAKGHVFCPHCLGSEYLEEKYLPLLRMQAIDNKNERGPLSDAEKNHLLPLFVEAQTTAQTEREIQKNAVLKADTLREYEKERQNAEDKKAGILWLLEHAPGLLKNHIFYNHTHTHAFGWRAPITGRVLDETRRILKNFPFPYEIQTEKK